jgi:REP element-mobilizing transposase RayT
MAQTLGFVLIHIVFSTKDRHPWLTGAVRTELHAYLATVARNAGCECFRVGGVADHIHLAIRLSRTIAIAKLVEELKTSSAKWIKAQGPGFRNFAWQTGYGVFSVSPNDIAALTNYIDSQETHHAKHTFEDEFRKFLKQYGIEWDEQYIWS